MYQNAQIKRITPSADKCTCGTGMSPYQYSVTK